MNKKPDLDAILAAVGSQRTEPEQLAPSEFGQRLSAVLAEAVEFLCAEGLVEVVESGTPALIAEVTSAGLDTRSPKQLMKRVVHTMIVSDYVEEVYGTDEMLFDALRRFLDPE